jgi:hypothetical protein
MKSLIEQFRGLPDYRKCKQIKFNVGEILYLALLAQMSGANGYDDMAAWVKTKKYELTKFLGHAFIAPAYTTIRNVFMQIDIDSLETLFASWSQDVAAQTGSCLNIVAADGKTMRGSANRIKDERARHIVLLFLAQAKLTLAQSEVDDKSNEIPALLELLEALELKNCVITVDTTHTQKNVTQDCTQAA